MLQIVEVSFLHKISSVRMATFEAWTYVIDIFATTNGFATSKRLGIVMIPIMNW